MTNCETQDIKKMMIQQRNDSVGYSRLSPSLQLCLAGYGGPESPYPHSSSPLPGG